MMESFLGIMVALVTPLWIAGSVVVADTASDLRRPAFAWWLIALIISPPLAMLSLAARGRKG